MRRKLDEFGNLILVVVGKLEVGNTDRVGRVCLTVFQTAL